MEPFVYPDAWQRSLRQPFVAPRYMTPLLYRYSRQLSPKQHAEADWNFLYSAAGSRWLLLRERKLRAYEVRIRVKYFHILLENERRTRFGLGFSSVFS
jgi:hypothetical protein